MYIAQNKLPNICNLYLAIIGTYLLAESLNVANSIVTFLLSVVIITISILYTIFVVFFIKKPLYLKVLTLMLIFFTLYGVDLIFSGAKLYVREELISRHIPNYKYLLQIYSSLLNIYVFYYFTIYGYLTVKKIIYWCLLFIAIYTINYFNLQNSLLESSNMDGVTNNMSYALLSVLPCIVFLHKKRFLQFLLLIYIVIFVFYGMKRGAIIACCVCLLYYALVSFRRAKTSSKFRIILFTLVLLLFAYGFVNYMIDNNTYFNNRIDNTMEGGGQRAYTYPFFYNYFMNVTSSSEFLFGMGANATLKIYINYAHNDWLELAINNGLLGVIIYIVYWIGFYKMIVKCKIPQIKQVLVMLFIIYFLKTLISMSYRDYTIVASMLLGYCSAITVCQERTLFYKRKINEIE